MAGCCSGWLRDTLMLAEDGAMLSADSSGKVFFDSQIRGFRVVMGRCLRQAMDVERGQPKEA
eukprot:1985732-Rhodomonas_salina.1